MNRLKELVMIDGWLSVCVVFENSIVCQFVFGCVFAGVLAVPLCCFGVWLVCAGGCMIFCSCFLVLGFASSGPGTVFCFCFLVGFGLFTAWF